MNSLSHHSHLNITSSTTRQCDSFSHSEHHNEEASVSTQPGAAASELSEDKLSIDPNSLKSESMAALSTSLNDAGVTLNTQSESVSTSYSSSQRHATVADNFTEAMACQTSLDSENTIRSPRAEYSIRKLQLLTASCREGKSKHRKKGKRFKQKSIKARSLQQLSIDTSTSIESEGFTKKPKFFTSDMLCVIMERNELKERVLQLEEKVHQLKE